MCKYVGKCPSFPFVSSGQLGLSLLIVRVSIFLFLIGLVAGG